MLKNCASESKGQREKLDVAMDVCEPVKLESCNMLASPHRCPANIYEHHSLTHLLRLCPSHPLAVFVSNINEHFCWNQF
jgi:hypothetical protein